MKTSILRLKEPCKHACQSFTIVIQCHSHKSVLLIASHPNLIEISALYTSSLVQNPVFSWSLSTTLTANTVAPTEEEMSNTRVYTVQLSWKDSEAHWYHFLLHLPDYRTWPRNKRWLTCRRAQILSWFSFLNPQFTKGEGDLKYHFGNHHFLQ